MIRQIIQDNCGRLSSKRVSGISLMTIGAIEKIVLFCIGLEKEIPKFTSLDDSANWLIGFGAALVFGGVFESKFTKKNDKEND